MIFTQDGWTNKQEMNKTYLRCTELILAEGIPKMHKRGYCIKHKIFRVEKKTLHKKFPKGKAVKHSTDNKLKKPSFMQQFKEVQVTAV